VIGVGQQVVRKALVLVPLLEFLHRIRTDTEYDGTGFRQRTVLLGEPDRLLGATAGGRLGIGKEHDLLALETSEPDFLAVLIQ